LIVVLGKSAEAAAFPHCQPFSPPVMRIREALDAICLILTVSANRRLTAAETERLEQLCSIVDQGVPTRPISSHAVRKFAENVRKSGVIKNGRATEVDSLLKDAESLKLLVG